MSFDFYTDFYAFSPAHNYMKENLPPTVNSEHNGHNTHKLHFQEPTAHWRFVLHFKDSYFSGCVIAKVFFIQNLSRFLDYNKKHDFVYLLGDTDKEFSTVKFVEVDTAGCYLPGGWTLLFEQRSERIYDGVYISRDEVLPLSMPKSSMGFKIIYSRPKETIDWLFYHLTGLNSYSSNDIFSIQLEVECSCYAADFCLEIGSRERSKSVTFKLEGKQHIDWLWLSGFLSFNLFIHNKGKKKDGECLSYCFYYTIHLKAWKLMDPRIKHNLLQSDQKQTFIFYKFR